MKSKKHYTNSISTSFIRVMLALVLIFTSVLLGGMALDKVKLWDFSSGSVDDTSAVKKDLLKSREISIDLAKRLQGTSSELRGVKLELQKLTLKKERADQAKVWNQGILKKTFESTQKSSMMKITSRSEILSNCDDSTRLKLEAWLRFIIAYNGFKADKKTIDETALFDQIILNLSLLNEIKYKNVPHFKSLVKDLLGYHARIMATPNWGNVFASVPGNASNQMIMGQLYSKGFSKSVNQCLSESLNLTISTVNNGGYVDVPYEAWAYTFWLRRHKENLLNETYTALNIIDRYLEKRVTRPKITAFWNDINDSGDQAKNEEPVGDYNKFLIGRKIQDQGQDQIAVCLNEKDPKLETNKVYITSPNSQSSTLKFNKVINAASNYNLNSSYCYLFDTNGNVNSPVLFLTNNSIEKIKNRFSAIALSKKDKYSILGDFVKKYDTDWGPQDLKFSTVACNTPPRVKKYGLGKKEIFILSKDCTQGTGEGVVGPSITAILSRVNGEPLTVSHIYFNVQGNVSIDPSFIADDDEDGNIEVVLKTSSGLGSEEMLVELNKNSWSVINLLSTNSEGEEGDNHTGVYNNSIISTW